MDDRKKIFKEKVSDYLVNTLEKIEQAEGKDSSNYKGIYNQYYYNNLEEENKGEKNKKHYEAAVVDSGHIPKGIERLYRRQAVVEITMVCAAHCRYCLRSNYENFQLRRSQIGQIVEYCSKDNELRELLISGGDPLMVPQLLMEFISEIVNKAPNIKIIRIGTRLPVHNPDNVDEELYSFFKAYSEKIKFELAVQINHPAELQDKACQVLERMQESGLKIYSQNVLLKSVNDDVKILTELYDKLRYLGIEAHYLFHGVPIVGTAHFRTSIERALKIIKELTSSGVISGRIKPMLSLMTDVGKVTLYEGSLGEKDEEGYYEVRTCYKLEERLKWNPNYNLPESAFIDKDGYIRVKYFDGSDED